MLDFFCAEVDLAIEVDGAAHDCGEVAEKDERRDTWLQANGVTLLRIPARQVLRDGTLVVEAILAAAERLRSSP